MAHPEHLLTVVEPTPGGDATLDLAHDAVEHGGTATVVMLVTGRVRRDIDAFARSENLSIADAEGYALEQLDQQCRERVGGSTEVVTRYGAPTDLSSWVTPETTAIAVPGRLMSKRSARKLAKRTGLPVTITPDQAA